MTRTVLTRRFLATLACSLVLMGCEDEEKKKALEEAEEAKMTLARVKVSLTKANRQIAELKEVLEVVTESRDELQKQNQLLQNDVIAQVEKAQEGINDRTSQLNRQTQSVAVLQNQIKKLNAVIEEQETIIAEQQIIIEQWQNADQQQNETVEEQSENEEEPQKTPEPD